MSRNIGTLVNSATAYAERSQASRLVDSWREETGAEYKSVTARLLAEVTALAAQEKTINSKDLTTTAKFDQTKTAVQDFVNNLKWLRNEKAALETRIGNIYGELFVLPVSKLNETVQAMRDREIRAAISQMPSNERDNAYLRSSETDQTEVLRALQDSPLPLVLDEVRLRADDERAARLQPKRYRGFVEAGELLNELSVILQDCLDLGVAFGLDVPESNDALGPHLRTVLDFAIQHVGGRGKRVLRTSSKDATSTDPVVPA